MLTVLVAALSACGEGPTVWSISEAALVEMKLGEMGAFDQAESDGTPPRSCQAAITLHPADLASTALEPAHLESLLRGAPDLQLECLGRCDPEVACKIHHTVVSPDPEFATTGCICDPQAMPPCRLTVDWVLADTGSRRIERVSCGSSLEGRACRFLLTRSSDTLRILCSASPTPGAG